MVSTNALSPVAKWIEEVDMALNDEGQQYDLDEDYDRPLHFEMTKTISSQTCWEKWSFGI